MKISPSKSLFLVNMVEEETKEKVLRLLPFKMSSLNDGCKYL